MLHFPFPSPPSPQRTTAVYLHTTKYTSSLQSLCLHRVLGSTHHYHTLSHEYQHVWLQSCKKVYTGESRGHDCNHICAIAFQARWNSRGCMWVTLPLPHTSAWGHHQDMPIKAIHATVHFWKNPGHWRAHLNSQHSHNPVISCHLHTHSRHSVQHSHAMFWLILTRIVEILVVMHGLPTTRCSGFSWTSLLWVCNKICQMCWLELTVLNGRCYNTRVANIQVVMKFVSNVPSAVCVHFNCRGIL